MAVPSFFFTVIPMTMDSSDFSTTVSAICKIQNPGGLAYGLCWARSLEIVEID